MSKPRFTVVGFAKVSGEPDVCMVQVTVTTHDKKQKVARDSNNEVCRVVLDTLKKVVPEKDLHAVPPRVWPNWNYENNRQRIQNYQAQNVISAKVRDLEKVSELVTELNAIDPEQAQVTSCQFAIEDKTALENEARKMAFDDAKARATLYANEAGFASVVLESLNEQFAQNRHMHYAAPMAMRAAAVAEAPQQEVMEIGDIEVQLTINAVFKASK